MGCLGLFVDLSMSNVEHGGRCVEMCLHQLAAFVILLEELVDGACSFELLDEELARDF